MSFNSSTFFKWTRVIRLIITFFLISLNNKVIHNASGYHAVSALAVCCLGLKKPTPLRQKAEGVIYFSKSTNAPDKRL